MLLWGFILAAVIIAAVFSDEKTKEQSKKKQLGAVNTNKDEVEVWSDFDIEMAEAIHLKFTTSWLLEISARRDAWFSDLETNYFTEMSLEIHLKIGREILKEYDECIRIFQSFPWHECPSLEVYWMPKVVALMGELAIECEQFADLINAYDPNYNPVSKRLHALHEELGQLHDDIASKYLKLRDLVMENPIHQETLAVFEVNYQRYEDIVTGFATIAEEPEDHYNAEERMATALDLMRQYAAYQQESIRQLNKQRLIEFDISVRLMEEELVQFQQAALEELG